MATEPSKNKDGMFYHEVKTTYAKPEPKHGHIWLFVGQAKFNDDLTDNTTYLSSPSLSKLKKEIKDVLSIAEDCLKSEITFGTEKCRPVLHPEGYLLGWIKKVPIVR